jgi:SAM-dependent methyltransferase
MGTSEEFANPDQAAYWNSAAPAWLSAEAGFELVGGEPGRMAMQRLALSPGAQVVDVGCGPGATTFELAASVGPSGLAVGIDIAKELVSAAQRRASDLALGNAEFIHGDAQTFSFERAAFDAAYSRFGLMFFEDPVTAFSNLRGAIRPGGRLSFVSWQTVLENEWVLVPVLATASVAGAMPSPPSEDEPGPFALSSPQRVRHLLEEAGFREVDIEAHNDQVIIRADQLPHLVAVASAAGPVQETLRTAPVTTRRRVVEAIEAGLREREHNGRISLSRGVLLVTASPEPR